MSEILRMKTAMSAGSNTKSIGSVVDLFCGAGGLSYGLKLEGFQIATGIDLDEDCRYAYETNNKAQFLLKDVSHITPREINQLFPDNSIRVLVGCAPCQPFSNYSQKSSDPKWRLIKRFSELVIGTLPDVVSMENVPALVSFQGGRVFDDFVNKLERKNYTVVWGILYGPDYGLAQTRSRLVLLASRLGRITLPHKTHTDCQRTVKDELADLHPIAAGEVCKKDPLHRSYGLSEINLQRIKASIPGGTWRDWPDEIISICHRKPGGQSFSSVYGRMAWDKPSPTITTQFTGFGNGRFGHPEQDRALSLREGALLQGFPKEYQFTRAGEKINIRSVARMIGNAVPVTLARVIGRSIKEHLPACS